MAPWTGVQPAHASTGAAYAAHHTRREALTCPTVTVSARAHAHQPSRVSRTVALCATVVAPVPGAWCHDGSPAHDGCTRHRPGCAPREQRPAAHRRMRPVRRVAPTVELLTAGLQGLPRGEESTFRCGVSPRRVAVRPTPTLHPATKQSVCQLPRPLTVETFARLRARGHPPGWRCDVAPDTPRRRWRTPWRTGAAPLRCGAWAGALPRRLRGRPQPAIRRRQGDAPGIVGRSPRVCVP